MASNRLMISLSKLQAPKAMKTVIQALSVFMKGLGNIITMVVVKAKIFDDQVNICVKVTLTSEIAIFMNAKIYSHAKSCYTLYHLVLNSQDATNLIR